MDATEPGKPGKLTFLKEVSESLEKSRKTVQIEYKSDRSLRIVLFIMVWVPQFDVVELLHYLSCKAFVGEFSLSHVCI